MNKQTNLNDNKEVKEVKGEIPNKWRIFTHCSKLFQFQIVLKNRGSVARDHMANEKTFLSWIRTALVFLTFSIGFLQFYRLEIKANTNTLGDSNLSQMIQTLGKPLGAMGTILSGLTVTFGTIRYFQVQELLLDDYCPVTRFTIIILILINLSILVVLFILNIDISLFVMS
ncbi:hypothetical protein MG7_02313 [Candida albicans P34048]|nr:hypothetical protein MG7_02313 [Candida albicans P34048]